MVRSRSTSTIPIGRRSETVADKHAVVGIKVGGVRADGRRHEVDYGGVATVVWRKLAGVPPVTGVSASGARNDLGAHRSVSGRTICGLAMM